jgi:hypothetical protein
VPSSYKNRRKRGRPAVASAAGILLVLALAAFIFTSRSAQRAVAINADASIGSPAQSPPDAPGGRRPVEPATASEPSAPDSPSNGDSATVGSLPKALEELQSAIEASIEAN